MPLLFRRILTLLANKCLYKSAIKIIVGKKKKKKEWRNQRKLIRSKVKYTRVSNFIGKYKYNFIVVSLINKIKQITKIYKFIKAQFWKLK